MASVSYARLEREVLELYRPPARRKSTWFKVRCVLREYRELGLRRVADITPQAVLRWVAAHTDRSPMTNRSYLSAFRAAVNYARKIGYLKVSPWEIRSDWIPWDLDEEDEPPAPRHLTADELGRLLEQLDHEAAEGGWPERRLQALGYLVVHTGLRTAEACGLAVADVDLAEGLIRVRSRRKRRLKTRRSARQLGIPDDLAPVLARWLPETGSEWLFPGLRRSGPWLTGGPGRKPLEGLQAAAERCGLGHCTIQMIRRSLATHLKRVGLGPLEVRDQLGHSSIQTQEWYLEEHADAARAIARRIRFKRARKDDRG